MAFGTGESVLFMERFHCIYNHNDVCIYVALNRAGRETEALHLLEQLAENAINETRYSSI